MDIKYLGNEYGCVQRLHSVDDTLYFWAFNGDGMMFGVGVTKRVGLQHSMHLTVYNSIQTNIFLLLNFMFYMRSNFMYSVHTEIRWNGIITMTGLLSHTTHCMSEKLGRKCIFLFNFHRLLGKHFYLFGYSSETWKFYLL